MKQPVWVAAIVVAAAGALVGGTTAFGTTTVKDRAPEPATAAEHYAQDMTLEEISAASQGEPGDVAPPCPDEAVVTELKANGLPIGPCDPVPESGRPVIVPETAEAADDEIAESGEACAGAFISSTRPGGSHRIEGPCGAGAQITDVQTYVDKSGTDCATVTYVAAATKPEQTSTICSGDPALEGQPNFVTKEN